MAGPDIVPPTLGTSPSRAILEAFDLLKRYGAFVALNRVSLSLAKGEIRAICGENGAGKSTLVKMLTGALRADAGSIAIDGAAFTSPSPRRAQERGVAIVSQELSLCPNLSVLDNVWLGSIKVPFLHRRRRLAERARAALDLLGLERISLTAPVSGLGMGERQLVEIARALCRDARVLILDEPTATLTDHEIERIFAALRALKSEGCAIIYVSHRLAEIFEICDSVTILRNGEHVRTCGIETIDRAGVVREMLGRDLVEMYPRQKCEPGRVALEVDDLIVPGRVHGVAFAARAGQITCIAGQLGSGSDAIVNTLAGLAYDSEGSIKVFGETLRLGSVTRALDRGIMFVSADRADEGLFQRLPVSDNLIATRIRQIAHAGFIGRADARARAKVLAARVGVPLDRLSVDVMRLSGGNQQKVAFGRCLDREASNILVMNEPTRGVDVGARGAIYRLMRDLCDRGYALVVASSDLEEIAGIADVVLTIYRGGIVNRLDGTEISIVRILGDITARPASAETRTDSGSFH
jgi:ABC-type sugar transport system ATPase subunit